MTKLPSRTDAAHAGPFRVDSIAEVSAPDGSEGVWYRYVITQEGANTITGVRAGERQEVGLRLDDMVECLNERRLGKYHPKSKGGPARRNKGS